MVMLPGECTVNAISMRWHTDFGKTKVGMDCDHGRLRRLLSFILFHHLEGVREGTFISRCWWASWPASSVSWPTARYQKLLRGHAAA